MVAKLECQKLDSRRHLHIGHVLVVGLRKAGWNQLEAPQMQKSRWQEEGPEPGTDILQNPAEENRIQEWMEMPVPLA